MRGSAGSGRRLHGASYRLAREDRQAEEIERELRRGADRGALAGLERESGMQAEIVLADPARPFDDDADLRAGPRRDAGARSGLDLQHRDLDLALGEAAEVLGAEARLLGIRLPVEMLRLDQNRLVVARLGIVERPVVDVFPDRLVAVAIA